MCEHERNHECDKQVIDICNEHARRAIDARVRKNAEDIRRQNERDAEAERAAEYSSFASFTGGLACAAGGISLCEVLLLARGDGSFSGTLLMLAATAAFWAIAAWNRHRAERIREESVRNG